MRAAYPIARLRRIWESLPVQMRRGLLIAVASLLASCGAARPRPEQAFSDLAGGACGGFEALKPAAAPVSLIADRLQITPLAGTEDRARSSLMGPQPADQRETRLLLESGDRMLVILSVELFARPGSHLLEQIPRLDARLANARVAEVALQSGLRATLAVQSELPPVGDAIPLADAFTELSDGTLQLTSVFVNRAVVSAGAQGCQTVAVKLLASLAPGKRQLDMTGGRRELVAGLAIDLPTGVGLLREQGPDFDVFHVYPVRELAADAPQLGIYIGSNPDFSPEANASERAGQILGETVTWHESQGEEGFLGEALLEKADAPSVHLSYRAPDRASADELLHIAESLRRGP